MDRRKKVHPGPDAGNLPHRARRAARGPRLGRTGAAAVAAGTVAGALFMAAPAFAGPAGHHAAGASHQAAAATSYGFTTLDDNADPTFNQLLGINSHDVISGYFGSGSAGHPNQGYLLNPPYTQANYTSENFPGSVQTQVTGLNNKGDSAGFYVNAKGTSHGFVQWNGVFAAYTDPNTPKGAGAVNQLLGINDTGTAVGFYNDKAGNAHAYQVNQATSQFIALHIPGKSATATGINNAGDVTGFATSTSGTTFSWLLHAGHLTTLQFPGGSNTQAFGVSDKDQIVGSYTDGSGTSHGFVLSNPMGPVSHWQRIDDPNGVGSTVVNGINAAGDLVGFYTDGAGNTDGMLATPNTVHLSLSAMPAGTVAFGQDSGGHLTASPNMFGLTPGSAHSVVLVGPDGTTLGGFGQLTANGTGQASATLDGTFSGSVPSGSRLEILNGTASDSVSTETIAETVPLSGTLSGSRFHLISVEVGSSGTSWGTPRGNATISYSPAAQTLTVTVTASGLTPGMHAAHIHLGSCQSQGGVQYMLMDFSANSQGQIQHETRMVTGVTTPIPAAGWYLNLHQGNSNNILSGGQPTIFFRPLLCANI